MITKAAPRKGSTYLVAIASHARTHYHTRPTKADALRSARAAMRLAAVDYVTIYQPVLFCRRPVVMARRPIDDAVHRIRRALAAMKPSGKR